MKQILQTLFAHKNLSRQEATEVMLTIARGGANEVEITALLTVFLMRSITIDELLGFCEGLEQLATPVDLTGHEVIDIVGTGGDGKNTFNISTLACFLVAGAGHHVAKHGNYGASSVSGASNVLEHLGYRFGTSEDKLKNELEQTGFTFLHAPLFHPALKQVGAIRKNLGFRTFFNMLGPLVNPARPAFQLVGVYNLELARVYSYVLQQKINAFTIVHTLDGYDEISLTGDAKLINMQGEKIMSAEALGKRTVLPIDIHGGQTISDAAKTFVKILKGQGSWSQNAVVLANAATAMFGAGYYNNYDDAYEAAVESFESGRAFQSFDKLIKLQS